MTEFLHAERRGHYGFITLDRPKALNALSLDMVRALTHQLMAWRDDERIGAVVLQSASPKAFCAGGDIRFFHQVGSRPPADGSALLEDFFTEEYALNHLVHHFPKPYIALADGVIMGGGMGISQAGPQSRICIVTERTKMAMPEVHIGLFPDVGASFFLTRTPGAIGNWLGLTGAVLGAADALHAELADYYIPSAELPRLVARLADGDARDSRATIAEFAAPFVAEQAGQRATSALAQARSAIDRHFSRSSLEEIIDSMRGDTSEWSERTLAQLAKGSPLMLRVTLEQLRRGRTLSVADCLRMERGMMRRTFEKGECLEGIRALAIDKDHTPHWQPPALQDVTSKMVDAFFSPVWPNWAHPLRHLV